MPENHPIVGRWYEIRPGGFYRVESAKHNEVQGYDWRRTQSHPGGFDGRFIGYARHRFNSENVMPEGFHPREIKNADAFARRALRLHFDAIKAATDALRSLGLSVEISAEVTEDFRLALDHLPADLRGLLEADHG